MTFDTGISKRLGIMVFILVGLLLAFHFAGFSGVSVRASAGVGL